jgi:precorrin-6B methylase 1
VEQRGSLTVVGTGIQVAGHLTPQARAALDGADDVLYLLSDPVARSSLEANPRARSLNAVCLSCTDGEAPWEPLIDELLAPVREGRSVCAAFDGHPGVFLMPAHEAVRRARAEGFAARMFPAISSLDCLFADLGIDPGEAGCHVHQATELLAHARAPDTSAFLVVLQISAVGLTGFATEPDWSGLPSLVDHLLRFYAGSHEAVVYEASHYPMADPLVVRVPLERLAEASLTPLSTLVLPPVPAAR